MLCAKSSTFVEQQLSNLEQLEHVVSHIVISELRVQHSVINVVDELEDKGGCLARRIFHHVDQLHYVGSIHQVL